MRYIFVVFINSLWLLGYSQCDLTDDFYQIRNQTDLDIMFENNPDCTELNTLFLYALPNENDPIINLNPLKNIHKINTLLIRNIQELKTLSGLENIDSINVLSLSSLDSLNNIVALYNLKDLNALTFFFNKFITNVSQLKNIKPNNRLGLIGDGDFSNYELDTDHFILTISSNSVANDFNNVFSNEPDSLGLSISGCSNFVFKGFEKYEKLTELFITGCENCSLNGLENLNSISNIHLQNTTSYDDEFTFASLENIEYSLNLWNIDHIKDFSAYFPSLNQIGSKLVLVDNDSLYHISVLNDIDIPTKPLKSFIPDDFNNSGIDLPVYFSNNKNLDYCSNDFICEALTTYPDSVFIEGNGTESCQYQGLLSYCTYVHQGNIKLPSSEKEVLSTVYPNPADSYIILNIREKNSMNQKFVISDIFGKKIKAGPISNQFINIDDIDTGSYIISIIDHNNNSVEQLRFVKR